MERARAAGGDAYAAEADVSDETSLTAAASALVVHTGVPDVVVINAGVLGCVGPIAETAPAEWLEAISVNLFGAFLTAREAVKVMKGRRAGCLLFISSICGLRGYGEWSSYTASKHGVIGLMKALANELSASNIRVNAICPGYIDTPLFQQEVDLIGVRKDVAQAARISEQLLGVSLEPGDVAEAVLWLASPQARGVTGVCVTVDAGVCERTAPASLVVQRNQSQEVAR